jgi:hypothetical protein
MTTKHFYQNLEGWFTFPSLYNTLINVIPENGKFVEVGVWKGKSFSYFVVENINNNKNITTYAVDTWEGSPEHTNDSCIITKTLYEEFISNMSSVADKFIPMRMTSEQASKQFEDNSLDAVFIDAQHEYEPVKRDLELWYPKVKSNGIFCGHDYCNGWPGVEQAVNEFAKIHNLTISGSEMCWATKKP